MIFLKRASASFMHKEDQTACLREMEAAGNWVDSLSLIFHRTLLLKSCMRKKGLFLVSTQHEMLLFILSRILRASELSQGSEWDSVTVRHFSGGLWRIKKKKWTGKLSMPAYQSLADHSENQPSLAIDPGEYGGVGMCSCYQLCCPPCSSLK